MKNLTKLGIIVLGVISLACGSIAITGLHGSGTIIEESYNVRDFGGVEMATICDLYIKIGQEPALTIEAEDNLIPYFIVEVQGDILKIRNEPGVMLRPQRPVKCYLTVESLETIKLSGSGNITAPDLNAEELTVILSGSGNITMKNVNMDTFTARISGSGNIGLADVEAQKVVMSVGGSGDIKAGSVNAGSLDVDISGSGNVELARGKVETQILVIGGSGNYKAKEIESAKSRVHISGCGAATIEVKERLEARISGSGNVYYAGNPTIEKSITGSGSLSKID